MTELLSSIRSGDISAVREALANGADPNEWDVPNAENPIFAAVAKHSVDLLKLLLEAGGNPNERDEEGGTPLLTATALGDLAILDQLLAAGANPKIKDRDGLTAVVVAAEKGHKHVFDRLAPLSAPAERRRAGLIWKLRDQSVDAEAVEALIKVAGLGELESVRMLLDQGVPVDGAAEDGMTALMCAANRGRLEVVEFLIHRGADPNLQDTYNECALCYAAKSDSEALFQYLLSRTKKSLHKRAHKSADFEKLVKNWRYVRPDLDERLRTQGVLRSDMERLKSAISGGVESVSPLLDSGIPVDAIDAEGRTALMHAAGWGHLDVVKELIRRGANVNHTDYRGVCALWNALVNSWGRVHAFLHPLTDPSVFTPSEEMIERQSRHRNWNSSP